MANRILRGTILTSEKVCSLTWGGEILYRRLMSIADDFGRFDARSSIVRSSLYPLQLDKVSESDVIKWMGECSKAELVRLYFVEKKPYGEILNFDQQLRIKKSKFPAPDVECKQMISDANHLPSDDSRTISTRMPETNPNPNPESETENLIIIAGEKFFKKGSVIWLNEYRNTLNGLLMGKLKGFSEKELLDRFDLEYPNYNFKDANHFANALKYMGDLISKEKSSGKKEVYDKSQRQDITWE